MPSWISWAAHSHLPLPSFRTYSLVSLGVFLGAVFNCSLFSSFSSPQTSLSTESSSSSQGSAKSWLHQMLPLSSSHNEQEDSQPSLFNSLFAMFDVNHANSDFSNAPEILLNELGKKHSGGFPKTWKQMPFYIAFLLQNSFVVWSLINLGYCALLLVARGLQKVIFGELRATERQSMRDSFWNYVFYKFIFIFGVLNVQQFGQLLLWALWFSMFSFLRLMNQLSKDRFEYVAYSPNTSSRTHRKIIVLLGSIFVCSILLFSLAVKVFTLTSDVNLFGFLLAECCQLFLRNLLIMLKYAFHLRDLTFMENWENKSICCYYVDFYLELLILSLDLFHHAHMLIWSNVFLSMACLVICMQVRHIIADIQHRFTRHKEFCMVTRNMDAMFPEVRNAPSAPENNSGISSQNEEEEKEQQEDSDPCAICWDSIVVGRKLPCSHIFHRSCLRSWLVQDSTCPTCRHALKFSARGEPATSDTASNGNATTPTRQSSAFLLAPGLVSTGRMSVPSAALGQQMSGGAARRNFFHFDGSRIASWLPSFSVEVTHRSSNVSPGGVGNAEAEVVSSSQREEWTNQIHLLFPQVPISAVRESLQLTNSIEETVDQILEGTIFIPPGSRNSSNDFVDEDSFSNVDTLDTAKQADQGNSDASQAKQEATTSKLDAHHQSESSLTFEPSAARASVIADEDTSISADKINPRYSLETPMGSASQHFEQQALKSEINLDSSQSSVVISETVIRQRKFPSSSKKAPQQPMISGNSNVAAQNQGASSTVYGERFSKNPEERQLSLQKRKTLMIESCRRAYLEKHRQSEESEGQ